ncbi:MAG: hypothetical protein KTR31_15280 [Myxococcales bacterium]|nr:hypothetical protein [Myxococcales bacterium]
MATLRTPALAHVILGVPVVLASALLVGSTMPSAALAFFSALATVVISLGLVEVWRRDRASQRATVLEVLHQRLAVQERDHTPITDPRWEPALTLIRRVAAQDNAAAEEVRRSLAHQLRAAAQLAALEDAEHALGIGASGLTEVRQRRDVQVEALLKGLRDLVAQVEHEDLDAADVAMDALHDAAAKSAARAEVTREDRLMAAQHAARSRTSATA